MQFIGSIQLNVYGVSALSGLFDVVPVAHVYRQCLDILFSVTTNLSL